MNNLPELHTGHRALMLALFGGTGEPPAWRADAACAGTDPDVFTDQHRISEARAVCEGCPVLAACRADQLEWESRSYYRRKYATDVVGGTTATERHNIHYPRTTLTKAA